MMREAGRINKDAMTVGVRLPADEVALLDAVTKRAGDKDRSTTIRAAIHAHIERYLPGSIQKAA
ncbi:MAG: ribbon-helix-helix protein, CopG family [Phycisphaerales bacterium]|jgi:metal-responsive CopG/Arc/MetJ family transcriptional regulator